VETTLAGGNVIRQMRDAKEQGFEIIVFYVGLADVRLNIECIALRVKNVAIILKPRILLDAI
jgi:predicted ABC-type ATPase